ncbi:transcriptional regulator [Nonomuraea sp. NPDC049152]|uniref:winged helix-turn-helix domain-containing protein n=1 Tax=Nonomuraea sp. NPDC049152 TaxID=3154350 RepID=UPI0033CD2CAC
MPVPDQARGARARRDHPCAGPPVDHGGARGVDRADFRFLKETIEVSDSLLSKHMLTLEEAGYVEVHKSFVGKRPRTSLSLTDEGRAAFAAYTAVLRRITGT